MTADLVPLEALAAAAELLARRVGLRADPAIQSRLTRCLLEGAAARKLAIADYVALVSKDHQALQDLLNRVTVQETSFFRDPTQFAALARHVLPSLSGPVTIWSSASSNGQEPYSLAMTLAESGLSDWRVIASDISTKALARTSAARYATRELRGLSRERQEHFMRPAGDDWEIVPALRERVRVVQHNLLSDAPPFAPGSCQVMFCRNVLIYLRDNDTRAVLDRFGQWLAPGGWLFLGYSESMGPLTNQFRLVRAGDAFLYQLGERAAAVPRPRAAARTRVRPPPAGRPGPEPRRVVAPLPETRSEPEPLASEHLAIGAAAQNAGDHVAAVAAFRRCVYLDPEHAVAHLNLALAYEAAGDATSARRAFNAARAALARSTGSGVEAALGGYAVGELTRLLDAKLGLPQRRASA
jgi:chemotaxis methyl-accepting protein methylase